MIKDILTSLKFKIAFFITVLLLVIASIFSLLAVNTVDRYILDGVIKRAESLSKSTAALASYSILSGDLLGLDNIVSKVKAANDDVEYVIVADAGFKIIAHTNLTKRGGSLTPAYGNTVRETPDGTHLYEVNDHADLLEILSPIMFNRKQVGAFVIGVNKSALLKARVETRKRIAAGFLIAMLLGTGCILVLSSFVARPIKELSVGVRNLKEGKSSQLKIYAKDELGELTASFNQMARLITQQQARLTDSAKELEEAYRSTVKVLAAAIDARDPYTLGHSTRVSKLALKIGTAMGLTEPELENLEIASLFHDVGKIKTPDYLLLKEGRLDPLERSEISNHSEHGAAILSRASSLQKYIPSVRHHHEWFNGEGYPDGLRGEDIPLHAAIIAVADSFDAMTSARPYKKPLAHEDAVRELIRFSGKQFDPNIVRIFHQVIESEPLFVQEFLGRER